MSDPHRRRMALLRVLCAAAWADGRLDTEEVNHIKERMVAYRLGDEEVAELDVLLTHPVPYSRCEALTRELLAMVNTGDEREDVLREIETLLAVDGSVDPAEREMLESLRGIMDAMTTVDGFVQRIGGVFRRMFAGREAGNAGELTDYLKNATLQRLESVSDGGWRQEIDAPTLNRYTLFGGVLGCVAGAEGGVSDEELGTIRRLLEERFSIHPPLLDWVTEAVAQAAGEAVDRQGLLSEFNRLTGTPERRELLEAAFAVAAADGEVAPEELEELRLISNYLWLDPRDFHDVRRQWAR